MPDTAKDVVQMHVVQKSRVSKVISKLNEPIPRFFESPNQSQGYWSEGEYDLMAIFKLLKTEALFFKATQKKLTNAMKSGVGLHSDNDEVKAYINNRFQLMTLQTGISLPKIVKELMFYLIIASNAFVIKVRDKNFQHAQSYELDGKEMHPVVGLFIPHPTSIKPRFKWVRFDGADGQIRNKLQLINWIFTNRRGVVNVFEPEDVAHFTLFKEEGMIFGTPEVIPVIDDIRTLRKMEEDIQLLIYRDLFPILHYQIENPSLIDHTSTITELDQAKRDLERMMQDGGIATDARHKIQYIGSQGKHIEARPYVEYFQQRVLSGLGVSATDVGIGQQISGGTSQTMSAQMIDYVKFLQSEVTEQFNRMILTEMMLQYPSNKNIFTEDMLPELKFGEVDIEWQIRKENHDADLFTKGVKTIDEIRNPMGQKDFSDEHFDRTHFGIYQKPQLDFQNKMTEKQFKHQVETVKQQQEQQTSSPNKPAIQKSSPSSKGMRPRNTASEAAHTSSLKQNAADRDTTKASKTSTNIVKHRDSDDRFILRSIIGIRDDFERVILEANKKENQTDRKFNVKLSTKVTYNLIKSRLHEQLIKGINDAATDLNLDNSSDNIPNRLVGKYITSTNNALDALADQLAKTISSDVTQTPKAINRIAIADRTEQVRAYNFGYAATCFKNGHTTFDTFHYDDDEFDTRRTVEIKSEEDLFNNIPPTHPNSKSILRIAVTEKVQDTEQENMQGQLLLDSEISKLANVKFTKEYISKTYGYNISDIEELPLVQNIEEPIVNNDEVLNSIKVLKDDIGNLKTSLNNIIETDDIHNLQDYLTQKIQRVNDSINNTSEYNSKMTSKYLEAIKSIVDSVNSVSKENTEGIKAIADSIPKEITIQTSPMDINVTNPPMAINIDTKKPKVTNKKIANIIRDELGRAVSIEIEEDIESE